MGALLHFRILGPLEVERDGARLSIGGPRQRALLAVLLCNANRVVSRDRLIDELFSDRSMDSAEGMLRVQISRLRKALNDDDEQERRLVFRPPGYVLVVNDGELDLDVFERLVREGRQAAETGNPSQAAMLFREAEGLWRGRPLADLEFEPFARVEVQRLEEQRLAAVEERIDADLALGRHASLCPELEALAAEQPLRERLHAQLMLALYRSGRQADALAVYQRTRAQLSEQLGLEPGPALNALQGEILRHSPSLRGPSHEAVTFDRPSGAAAGFGRVEDHRERRTEPLVGREREIEELTALLTDPEVRLVTLAGTGGAGKTALALRVAQEVGPSFGDGVVVVWLANISGSAQVLPEVARRLGVEVTSQEPAINALVRVLRLQHRLLLLDNFEHVLDAAGMVAQLIRECGQLRVLATSRAPLRVSLERVYSVRGLEVPSPEAACSIDALAQWPATALFIDRARAADAELQLTTDTGNSIAELCRYLAGLPLALELAAVRARVLTPGKILDRLRTSSESLGPGRRDAPERHRTLQATIDWSFNLLTADEQTLFAVVGLFVGGFTADAAEAVCGKDVANVLDGLAILIDHGLVQRTRASVDSRLGMLEPIREYALRRLRADGCLHDAARVRLAEYYANFAESAAQDLYSDRQLERLHQLDDELGNLRAVLIAARSQPQLDLALRVASALRSFWDMRDLDSEVRGWLRWALGQPLGDRAIRLPALVALGALSLHDSDNDGATATLLASLPACDELGDASLTAWCEAELAHSLHEQGDAASSIEHAERASALAVETGDHWTQAKVMSTLGLATDNVTLAYERLQRALSLYTSLGDRLWSTPIKANLSWYAIAAGDYEYARTLTDEAAVEGQGIWGTTRAAQLEAHRGLADLFEGRHSEARQHLSRSLVLSLNAGWWAAAQEALAGLAAVAAIEGKDEQAVLLAAAARSVTNTRPGHGDEKLVARLNELSKGLINAAADQPPLAPQRLDAILRDASQDQAASGAVAIR